MPLEVQSQPIDYIMQSYCTIGMEYLPQAIKYLDTNFGSGYAIRNPALIGAMIAASVEQYKALMLRDKVD